MHDMPSEAENYLVGTVFLVDHPSQHPRAELAELGEPEWDWEKIPSPAVVFQWREEERSRPVLDLTTKKKESQLLLLPSPQITLQPLLTVLAFCLVF